MSEKDQNPSKPDDESGKNSALAIELDDIELPGLIDSTAKAEVGSATYTIFVPSTTRHGTPGEYEKILDLTGRLDTVDAIGAVTRLTVSAGVWSIVFGLKGEVTTPVVKAAFDVLNPIFKESELLDKGFVQDDLPVWRLMNGTKVVRKGNFKKKA